ncbi:DUF3515 family protein [Glycomyces algeriensis]|uniref:DUF3515 family protein n=1 Tax=Glycomyces algeriensis TaxID=256037 RepID=A0A9W6GBB8_9ACTN|nr:DUF3515 family protein [Glycomyces algeriensis]MDA1366493.1 DUF3515 family protein [Glycomyces algeriensis]MDR7352151.1 hypothetical protein [Glycomyces algeriensis]GLI44885.1 hypothetical protein GALLR39Z86_47350 [Glycomyces algeriensis]
MGSEKKSRLPAIVATAVAVPVAVVAGVLVFNAIAPKAEPVHEDLSPVAVEVPALSEEDAVVCLALTATAPESAGGLQARPVEGGAGAAESVMAYGDPAVVATCGVEPVAVEDTALVYKLNGVCWYSDEAGLEWTSLDRQVPVGVSVPETHEQPVDVLNDLSTAIADKVPAAAEAPTGCA